MRRHNPESVATSSSRLTLLAIVALTWLALSSYLLAVEANGLALQLLGAVGLPLTALVALEIGPRDRRWIVGTLLAVGILGLGMLEWFMRFEIHGAGWYSLRLALAAVRILPAVLAGIAFIMVRRTSPGDLRRWAVGLTVAVFGTALMPIASLYVVCYSGYDCL